MNELDEAWAEMIAGRYPKCKSDRTERRRRLSGTQTVERPYPTDEHRLVVQFVYRDRERSKPAESIAHDRREEPHEFSFQNAKMAGSLIRIVFGVRRLMVEAGWTRLPSHGFMRNQALAAARISHFGMPKAGEDLILIRNGEVPVWSSVEGHDFDSERLREHFVIFLG